ncbi:MAG: DUF4235 domain-containing protein [Acidimicrobiia bacterium]|nr:DUF4235 domain-containing protein [Acidimicrobiia bacterium]
MDKVLWKALSAALGFAAAWAARNISTSIWSRVSDGDVPVNPANREVSWMNAVGWAVLAGSAAGLARVVGRRGAAAAWVSATGDTPPGL